MGLYAGTLPTAAAWWPRNPLSGGMQPGGVSLRCGMLLLLHRNSGAAGAPENSSAGRDWLLSSYRCSHMQVHDETTSVCCASVRHLCMLQQSMQHACMDTCFALCGYLLITPSLLDFHQELNYLAEAPLPKIAACFCILLSRLFRCYQFCAGLLEATPAASAFHAPSRGGHLYSGASAQV